MSEKKIFISFASQEGELAVQLQDFIHAEFPEQCSVFVSDTTITAGEHWETEIKNAIKEAELVFVLCSPLSISRQWVNFECGAASFNNLSTGIVPSIIPLCHSGLRKDKLDKLMPFAPWEENRAIDVHSLRFLDDVCSRIKTKFNIKNGSGTITNFKNEFDLVLNNMARRIDKKEEEKGTREAPKYLLVSLEKNSNGSIEIKYVGESESIKGPMQGNAEKTWLSSVKDMHDFVAGDSKNNKIASTGIAIGVQNCLYDGSNIYVGVRMKSMKNAYSSSMGVAKGKFNTGYELLQSESKRKIESINSIQDLFISMPTHIKQTVQKSAKNPIYEKLKQRVEAVNSKLWNIKFDDESTGVASIFVNNSSWFPRLEIGIWKFIDLSSPHKIDGKIITCKAAVDDYGIIDGFGEDVFLDYRGQEDTQETPLNFWIWVKDGEICYWSYPEERLIQRKKPGKPPKNPMHAVLLSTDQMKEAYGHIVKYTPFVSDEKLNNPDAVLAEQFSLPARALLSCF